MTLPDSFYQHPTLFNYIASYLTPQRKLLMEKVIQERTRYVTTVVEDFFKEQNASAVIRSCKCFGVQDAYFIEKNFEFKANKGIVKGAIKWMNIYRYPTLTDTVSVLKTKGYKIAGTVLSDSSLPIQELPLDQKVAVMFGTEQFGLTPEAIAACDYHVKIPMYGFTESFNMSVSAALVLANLTRRMREENREWPLLPEEKRRLTLEWMFKHIKGVRHMAQRYLDENPA